MGVLGEQKCWLRSTNFQQGGENVLGCLMYSAVAAVSDAVLGASQSYHKDEAVIRRGGQLRRRRRSLAIPVSRIVTLCLLGLHNVTGQFYLNKAGHARRRPGNTGLCRECQGLLTDAAVNALRFLGCM